jgi:hypothetical protein
MVERLARFDVQELRREFQNQGAFLYLPEFLGGEITAQLVAAVAALEASVNRNYLPGHKQGGPAGSRYCRTVSLGGAHPLVGGTGGRIPRSVASD